MKADYLGNNNYACEIADATVNFRGFVIKSLSCNKIVLEDREYSLKYI